MKRQIDTTCYISMLAHSRRHFRRLEDKSNLTRPQVEVLAIIAARGHANLTVIAELTPMNMNHLSGALKYCAGSGLLTPQKVGRGPRRYTYYTLTINGRNWLREFGK